MNQQSVYFLQALWDGGIKTPQLLNLGKKGMKQESSEALMGLWNRDTLWISEEAKSLRRQMEQIVESIDSISAPAQLTTVLDRYERVLGELRALQVETMQCLTSEEGPALRHLHVIVPPLFTMAGRRLENHLKYQLYRLMVFGKTEEMKKIKPVGLRTPYHWVEFYRNTVEPGLRSLGDRLDGRWAYERRKIKVLRHLVLEQYIAVAPREEELAAIPGRAYVGVGQGGDMRIFGRGRLTNISPDTLLERWDYLSQTTISSQSFYETDEIETKSPEEILEFCFKGREYLMDVQGFFRAYNEYLIGQTIYYRVKRGNCLYCGGMISRGQCERCGQAE